MPLQMLIAPFLNRVALSSNAKSTNVMKIINL